MRVAADQREADRRDQRLNHLRSDWINHYNYDRKKFASWSEWLKTYGPMIGLKDDEPEDMLGEWKRAMESYSKGFGG